MRWYEPLYVGDSLIGQKSETIQQIESGSCSTRVQIITLASNGQDLLDIRRAAGWSARCGRKAAPTILGIAGSRKEALEIVQRMIEECWLQQGNANLRSFFAADEE